MAGTKTLIGDVQVRLLRQADAELMSAAYERNREHLAPWEPERSEHFFTPDGQSEVISAKMDMHASGSELPWVLQVGDRIVGCLTLTGIVRGPFLSAHIGYWVDSAFTGKRLASAAVAFAVETAGRDLGLHRLQAATLRAPEGTVGREGCPSTCLPARVRPPSRGCVAGPVAAGDAGPGHPELRTSGLVRSRTCSLSPEGLVKKRELPLKYVVLADPHDGG